MWTAEASPVPSQEPGRRHVQWLAGCARRSGHTGFRRPMRPSLRPRVRFARRRARRFSEVLISAGGRSEASCPRRRAPPDRWWWSRWPSRLADLSSRSDGHTAGGVALHDAQTAGGSRSRPGRDERAAPGRPGAALSGVAQSQVRGRSPAASQRWSGRSRRRPLPCRCSRRRRCRCRAGPPRG